MPHTPVTAFDGSAALGLLDEVLARATRLGADAADALLASRRAVSVAVRLGKQETLERSEANDLGLRVLIGHRQALVSSSDFSAKALDELVARAVAMAQTVPEDPFCGLADAAELVSEAVDVDSYEDGEPDAAPLMDQVMAAEAAAMAVAGITNPEGSEASWGIDATAIAASNGFAQSFRRSWHSLSVSVVAGEGTAMERDYDYGSAVYAADMPDAAGIGQSAAEKAVRRLNPRKVASAQVPVIYAPRVARGLLSHLVAAISGPSVARGTSFLKDKLGQPVFRTGTTVIDDPLRRRGLRSRPFDAEGIPVRRRKTIDDGRLTTWLLDLRSARQLRLASTGHATRGTASLPSPSPSNLFLEPGSESPDALIAAVGRGLYVTDMMGFGVNGVTGEYSRGASGFWIENGWLAYPVSEVTVSGNLIEMFRSLTAASDLEFHYGIDSPTVRIDGMTVAGR